MNPLVKLGEFCDTGTGGTPPRNQSERYFEGGTIPWVKSGELRESIIAVTEEHVTQMALVETNMRLVPRGAVLLAMYGATVGRLAMLGVQATTNQAVCHIIPDPAKASPRYLYFALRASVPQLLARRVGGAQPNISQGIIRNLDVRLPPVAVQVRIADLLDRADALRAKRRAALALLDTLPQSIFIEMFGDPARDGQKEWRRVGDLLESATYGTSEKASPSGSIAVLRMNNVTPNGQMNLSDLKFMDLSEDDLERYTVKAGDLLFNRTNSPDLVGKTAVFGESKPMAYAGYLIRLRTNTLATPEYLNAFLNGRYGKAKLRGMCKSIIGMANINATEVKAMRIPVPAISLQQQFASRIAAVDKLKTAHRASLAELDALFASLQHRAFRGEL